MSDAAKVDPFEQFAKQMASTEEAVRKVAEKEPPPPTPMMSEEQLLDAYVDYQQYLKEKKAADDAFKKARNQLFGAKIDEIILNNLGPDQPGIVGGLRHALKVEYSSKPVFNQDALRAIDLYYSALAPITPSGIAPPVTGLSVSYSGNPSDAINSDVAKQIEGAITGEKITRKVTTMPMAMAGVPTSADE